MQVDKSSDNKKEAQGTGTADGLGTRGAARIPTLSTVRNGLLRSRKQPRQARSRHMVEAILQAAAEVFAEYGYAHATTNKIADRAGASVGSLYQYYPNKDSLLLELLAQHHADADRVISAALERLADLETPLEQGLRGLLTDLMQLHQENPALTRALSLSVLRQSPAMEEMHKDDDQHHLLQVVGVLSRRPDVRTGDHRAMALILGQATGQLCRWLVHDAPPGPEPGVLLEEVVQLLTRYIAAPDAASGCRGQGEE